MTATGISGHPLPVSIVNSFDIGTGQGLHVVVVAIQRQSSQLGRMIAIRNACDREFGTVEADLMKSTSLMLGVHLINQRQYLELQQMFAGMIHSLASALDAKDTYTRGHSSRVADLSVELSKRLGYDSEAVARIRMGGILHDIGKIGVDDSVLRKPGRLTEEEFDQIKKHPMIGYEILKGIRQFAPILPIVRNHHESWDGRGYPDQLAGDKIPRDAQIVAVADSFDAMTSDRPYRRGMSLEKVVDIFKHGRGSQWAADVVDVLLSAPDVMIQFALRDIESSP
jgi:putative nucleotidyltransferase with HDIG domain